MLLNQLIVNQLIRDINPIKNCDGNNSVKT